MHIEHIAIWTIDIEHMREFYCHYFGGSAGEKYTNPQKQFQSYFISFEKGPRLELMQLKDVPENANDIYKQFTGLIHFAVALGTEEKVKLLTEELVRDGFELIDGPRWTGDGYFESVILDPEKNRVEITL